MTRHRFYEAIVLRTHDVGEADRFCILFTREQGRIAARARGVRRAGSALSGYLLSFQHVFVELQEHRGNFTIVGARSVDAKRWNDVGTFVRTGQAAMHILMLLHEQQPMPEVFDLLSTFVHEPHGSSESLLLFHVRLLSLLGTLPITEDANRFAALSDAAQMYLRAIVAQPFCRIAMEPGMRRRLQVFADAVTGEYCGSSPALSPHIAQLLDSYDEGSISSQSGAGSVVPLATPICVKSGRAS
jgi:DNA repair protein RecO